MKMKVYLQLGKRFTKGKKMGPPAQTMVRIFTEMVLNLMAALTPGDTRYFCDVVVDCGFVPEEAEPDEEVPDHEDDVVLGEGAGEDRDCGHAHGHDQH